MIRLLKCEFKKFKGTYINALSFLGMLSPLLLIMLMFIIQKNQMVKTGSYNWNTFNNNLQVFFVFLVGPIITSFIAVFSIFYEYQENTMKNIVASPHGRSSIVLSKIIYVMAYVLLQYLAVAVLNILIALLLGFNINTADMAGHTKNLLIAGLGTVMLIPFMMLGTLIFKSFIPMLVITVAGTISNILMLNWDYSYISPWTIPLDIMFIADGKLKMNIAYPLSSLVIYFVLFVAASLIYFNRADQKM